MAAPQWVTSAGSLGTAVELKPFELELAVATGNSRAEFNIVSGSLPPGLILTPSGNIKGYPSGKLSGVPLDVNEEKIFTFVIRCTNDVGELADRTFSITVTGQDAPQPRPAPYANRNLGSFADGTWVDLDVTAYDTDPGDVLTYQLVGGALPPGLTLSSDGRITGYAEPISEPTLTFNFDLHVTDGKIPVIASYNIIIVQSDLLTSDTTEIYTDSSLSDSSVAFRAPVLLDRGLGIDTVLDENYFYYRFRARDFDGDDTGFEVLPILRRPTIISTVVNPALDIDDEITVDDVTVTLTGSTVQDLAADINQSSVPGVSAEVNNGRLLLYTINPTLSLLQTGNTNTVLQDLGLTYPSVTVSRNADDTDNIYLTEDQNEVLPQDLTLNSDTGWLYGYIKPITQGEKNYTFWVRVYKKKHEASDIQIVTDYATTLPFSLINNQTQAVLDNLGLDIPYTDYVGKTIVFFQQENMEATYDDLNGTTYTTNPDSFQVNGWFDSAQATVAANASGGGLNDTFTVINAAEIAQGALVTGNVNIAANTVVSVVAGNTITMNANIGGSGLTAGDVLTFTTLVPGWTESTSSTDNTIRNQRAGLWRFAESANPGYFALEFVQEIQQGTIVYARKFTGTDADSYSMPSVKRLYQTGSNWDPTAIIQSNSVISTVILDSIAEIQVGATVTGANITTGTIVSNINPTLSTITMNAAPTGTLVAGNVLTFSSLQTEPRYTEYHLINPSSTLWKKRLTVSSSYNYLLEWVTDTDLGELASGVPSKLQVKAINRAGSEVRYSFAAFNYKTVSRTATLSEYIELDNVDNLAVNMVATGEGIVGAPVILSINTGTSTVRLSSPQTLSTNTVLGFAGTDLPRGLRITDGGEIIGRPSHQHFALEDGTTFDQNQTTFDRSYTINVMAETALNDPIQRTISSTKTFTFRVTDYKNQPSSNFYLHFALPDADRNIIYEAIHNDLIIPDQNVYRADDHWFGRQQHYRMLVAYGLDPATDAEVVGAIAAYHYNKRYIFRGLKWAQSLNAAGNVEYEVIYIDLVDQLTTQTGNTIVGPVNVKDLAIPLTLDGLLATTDTDLLDASLEVLLNLYPASLPNMQNRLKTMLSPSNRRFLPSWMTSRQPDNRTPNFTQAVPLVYLKPGTGRLALYKLQQVLNVNQINAVVDRYAWDDGLALNYDKDNAQFLDNQPTTWDQVLIDDSVQIRLVGEVDFAVDVPFCQINGKTARELQVAGTVDGARGTLHNKTLVFYQQENFTATELAEFSLFQGWGRLNPSFDESELVTLTAPVVAQTVITVDNAIRIRQGMTAQGSGVIGSPTVVSVDTDTNTITLSSAQTLNVGSEITFVDDYGDNYESYRVIPGWTDLTKTQTITATVNGTTTSSANVVVDSIYLIQSGQTVLGTGIVGSSTVTGVDDDTKTVTLSTTPSLTDGTVLTFTTPGAAAAWLTDTSYVQGNIVIYSGQYYICILTHLGQPSFPVDYFVLLDLPQNQYQRAGIWRMIENEDGIITLRFEQALSYTGGVYDSVAVRSGVRHGGQIVSLVGTDTLGAGYTVPGFVDRDSLMTNTDGTIFDNRTTEFFDENTDTYLDLDQGTKYIKFTHSTIIDRGIVDV